MLSQTCIHLFLVLNTKEDILKNVGNQTHWICFKVSGRKQFILATCNKKKKMLKVSQLNLFI